MISNWKTFIIRQSSIREEGTGAKLESGHHSKWLKVKIQGS